MSEQMTRCNSCGSQAGERKVGGKNIPVCKACWDTLHPALKGPIDVQEWLYYIGKNASRPGDGKEFGLRSEGRWKNSEGKEGERRRYRGQHGQCY